MRTTTRKKATRKSGRSSLARAERAAKEKQWAREAFERAQSGGSLQNDMLVIAGFEARGLPVDQIEPRVNVLSFHAWKHLGRSVMKGERGVKVPVISAREIEKPGGKTDRQVFRTSAAVFHISQTKVIGDKNPSPGSGLGPVEDADRAMEAVRARFAAEREAVNFSGAAVSRKVIRAATAAGFDPGGEIERSEFEGPEVSFTFRGAVPAELREALQGLPAHVRMAFRPNVARGGGDDSLADLGVDGMIRAARDLYERGAASASAYLGRGAPAGPDAEMLAVVFDLRQGCPASERPRIELASVEDMPIGAAFEIMGEPFAVYERGGCKRAGGRGHDFNLDQVVAVPIDAGTLDAEARITPEAFIGVLPY